MTSFDPLDLEILERALESTRAVVARRDCDSDEALEAELRRELIEIARANGIRDTESLRDLLLSKLSAL